MEQNATLNTRMPATLKRHGCEVLEHEGIGVSEAIRRLFEYLERFQKMPDELMADAKEVSPLEGRRAALRGLVASAPLDCSAEEAIADYRQHLTDKYCPNPSPSDGGADR